MHPASIKRLTVLERSFPKLNRVVRLTICQLPNELRIRIRVCLTEAVLPQALQLLQDVMLALRRSLLKFVDHLAVILGERTPVLVR